MNKYIIMSVQGCGKGTQAKLLKEVLDLVHISVGDILRWHIQSRTKLGARIKRIMAEGQLGVTPRNGQNRTLRTTSCTAAACMS
jgi:adenylate kinase